MDEAEQRRLPKKRLLQSFHLEEAAERENYNSQGNALTVPTPDFVPSCSQPKSPTINLTFSNELYS